MNGSTKVSADVARELRAAMARRRISGREMARRTGYGHSTIDRLTSGEQTMSIDQFATMVAALDDGNLHTVVGMLAVLLHTRARHGDRVAGVVPLAVDVDGDGDGDEAVG